MPPGSRLDAGAVSPRQPAPPGNFISDATRRHAARDGNRYRIGATIDYSPGQGASVASISHELLLLDFGNKMGPMIYTVGHCQ